MTSATPNSRRIHGYSLRRSLEEQGVNTEKAMRNHLLFVHQTLKHSPYPMDITRYRVNPNYPNGTPLMG